ncbi:MAG TPA: tetratricopeptide repeat protein [Chthonomonas sp.]|uniref:tetratricopeptide repeat protein n=1 Tax=Chthonomonas sp. TaxID=2282153 RepID=UPI002B4B3F0E|nr:tetratricopeptide repeat protein [Chthonomonas sp.]HLI49267.1 tetratricopeptide repeat protein [Chthonomonas sp.]
MDTNNASLTNQGIQALQSGHLTQAVDLLGQALRQDPNDALAATYLGIAYCRQKDFETGIQMLTQATQLQPANGSGI